MEGQVYITDEEREKCRRVADAYSELFNELWRIWYEYQVLTPVLGTPLAELDYEEIFKCLPKGKQEEIMEKQDYFKKRAGDKVRIWDKIFKKSRTPAHKSFMN